MTWLAQKVIVPKLLGEDEAVVSRANALFQGAIRVALLLGPVIGGVLVVTRFDADPRVAAWPIAVSALAVRTATAGRLEARRV